MPHYSAKIKYKYGSGKATTSTSVGSSQIEGKSESAVMAFLKKKHQTVKNLEILIEKIEWKE